MTYLSPGNPFFPTEDVLVYLREVFLGVTTAHMMVPSFVVDGETD